MGGTGSTVVAGLLTGIGTVSQPVILNAGGSISGDSRPHARQHVDRGGNEYVARRRHGDLTGATTVNSGASLAVNGTLFSSSGAATVFGTLGGAGIVNEAVTVKSGGTIAGASGATLTLTSGLTLEGGSFSSFALTPDGADNATALVAVSNGFIGASPR